ncbi:MAG: PHB depolymerase family esterase [Flavobacteriales bacterium]|nr:PHB depolymerase family esterase [Flavobacteriales bacterium]MCB9168085.1 PHB depolymerase family esterase [Flavobacteriales bacterium]
MWRGAFLTVSCLLAMVSVHAQSDMREVKDFGPDPGNLRMFVHAPRQALDGNGKRPLIVVLHGCTQKARRIARLSGWNELADRLDCYILYAQQRPINNSLRCFDWFREDDIRPGEGETGSITNMVRYALAELPVDPDSVFLYGVSSGGALCSALMACEPDLFKGVAIFAGGPYRAADNTLNARMVIRDPKELTPSQWGDLVRAVHPGRTAPYPHLIVMHGTEDGVVNIGHGMALVAQWTNVAGADTVPETVDRAFQGLSAVRRTRYDDPDGHTAVIFYRIEGLGHQLPVHPGDGPQDGGRTSWVSRDVGFHSTYVVAQEFGLLPGTVRRAVR